MFNLVRKITLGSLLVAVAAIANAQGNLYSLAAVPDIVKAKAAVVMHSESHRLEIEGPEKSVYKVHQVYTVLNESGKSALIFNETSSSLSTLTDVELRVIDANGKQVGKYKKKDMRTEAYGEGLIDDGYVTWYRVLTSNYPVTIDVEYTLKNKGTFFLPAYYFNTSETGVVSSDYTIVAPADMNIRYRNIRTSIQPVITTEGNAKTYRWAVNSLPPFEYEAGGSANTGYPHINFVADKFSYGGYPGDFSSWQNFGKWYYTLCAGLDKLTPEREGFFRNLVKDAPDDREKARLIYKYLQDNFRFVSIQLGIGGLRPMSAAFTDKQKYGDCKALSNFTKAALNAVGVKSYLAVINRNTNGEPADPAFPANTFNHVILCVPVGKDSVWLECTSTTADFATLETSTENRNAVVVNENGGFLVATPKSNYTSNFLGSHTTVKMQDDLSALTETHYYTRGEYAELMSEIYKQNRDDQKQLLVSYLGYKQPDDFLLVREDKHHTSLKQAVNKIPEFSSGDKLFITHRVQKIWSSRLPKSENRQQDFYFTYPFEKRDTTLFVLPAGTIIEVLPKTKTLESPYSSYEVSYRFDEPSTTVVVTSSLILRQHRIPVADFAAVKKFFDDVITDNSQKVVIRKGEAAPKKAF
ncbi:MAG: DUF3857 domain-containing protein [Chitinophagaceae bacterium]|nr:MAG: DUF3857 domain-containing protein [Chitinophagaceae bacterium]